MPVMVDSREFIFQRSWPRGDECADSEVGRVR